MNEKGAIAVVGLDQLIAEIEAYLRVVEAFRRENAEPAWALERRRRPRKKKEASDE